MKKQVISFLLLIILQIVSYSQNNLVAQNSNKSKKESPNFIFILADDLGWNELSVRMDPRNPLSRSNYIESPNIEKLASEGMVFSNAYAPAPLCTPTRRSIQFGMTPARQKGTEFESQFNPAPHLSIAQMLKKIDDEYVAAHFGKWGEVIVGTRQNPESEKPGLPDRLGYDFSDGKTGNKTGIYYSRNDTANYHRNFVCEPYGDPKLTFSVTKRACAFIENQKATGKPFYLQVSYYAIHTAAQARPATMQKYAQKGPIPVQASDGIAPMIDDMDTAIGMILNTLKNLELEETTYVFFTSDNGGEAMPENFIDHTRFPRNMPLKKEKQWLYEGGIRVPFIARGPNIAARSHSSEPIVGYDLWMTLFDLANGDFEVSEEVDAVSLKNALFGIDGGVIKRPEPGIVFHRPKDLWAWPGSFSAIRKGDYKLVVNWRTGEKFLYNVSLDISESYNLSLEKPELTKQLYSGLVDYLTKVEAEGEKFYLNLD